MVEAVEVKVPSGFGAVPWKRFFNAALAGTAFGVAMEKTGVYLPAVIHDQFFLTDMTMLRTFLGAAAGSSFSLFILRNVSPDAAPAAKATVVAAQAAGGFLLGTGMFICGSCPGYSEFFFLSQN